LSATPEHWCHVPDLVDYGEKYGNLSLQKIKQLSIPRVDLGDLIQIILNYSRIIPNIPELIQNIPELFRNILEYSRIIPELFQNYSKLFQIIPIPGEGREDLIMYEKCIQYGVNFTQIYIENG
jgi:hypothetical protein